MKRGATGEGPATPGEIIVVRDLKKHYGEVVRRLTGPPSACMVVVGHSASGRKAQSREKGQD